MRLWCRSCGLPDVGATFDACPACGVDIEASAPSDSRIGLVYEPRSKLVVTRKLAVCIGESEGSVTLHISPKEPRVETPITALPSPSDLVPEHLSPAGRLLEAVFAANARSNAKWDIEVLRSLAADLLDESVGARRQLVFEAFDMDWDNVVEWVDLVASEKTWYRAHDAAARGDLEELHQHLVDLPEAGYVHRVELLYPYVPELADARSTWGPLLRSWTDRGLDGAEQLDGLVSRDWTKALAAGAARLRELESVERADAWEAARDAFSTGQVLSPLVPDSPSWYRASVYFKGLEGTPVDGDGGSLAGAQRALLDDLIDAGGIGTSLDFGLFDPGTREYLQARLAPEQLSDDQLVAVGHTDETGRRAALARDRSRLAGLDSTPAVEHYRALVEVLNGGPIDLERLRPETVQILEVADEARSALRDGTSALPALVIEDSTVWPMFTDLFRNGAAQVDSQQREGYPSFAQWADLQRLLGLLWRGEWNEGAALGERLADSTQAERIADEALSMAAFARYQQGDPVKALVLLERALDGEYTEALLVNTSIVATSLAPDVAAPHFARLVREAPTDKLKVAAMLRAVRAWQAHPGESEFPMSLIDPLEDVLSCPMNVDDFGFLARVVADVAPRIIISLKDPGKELSGPYRIQKARARLSQDKNFGTRDLALEYIAVSRQVGDAPWFAVEWGRLMDTVRSAIFVPFGEGFGTALFVDTVNTEAPDLLDVVDRYILLPQAGTHIAVMLDKDDEMLSDEAFKKFFYLPIEHFLAHKDEYDSDLIQHVADNMSRTLILAGVMYVGNCRNSTADPYNALVERLRYDYQNAAIIKREMRNILGVCANYQSEMDRMLDRLKRLPLDTPDHRERIRDLTSLLDDYRSETISLRANL